VTSIDPTARSSDHAPFWNEGYPAIFGIETDFNDYYHSPQDTVDKMSFELVTGTTRAAVATIAKIAGIYTPGDGVIVLDRTSYSPTDTVGISLYDTDLNTDPGAAETVQVNIRSSSEPMGEQVTLTETSPDEGVFKGIMTLTTASTSPGELTVASTDVLNATYVEANPAGLRWANADVDGVIPLISNVAAVPSVTTATITWDTNEDADSLVSFGLTTGLGSSESDWHMTTSHSIELGGLSPGTQYYFEVASMDSAGNLALDDNGGLKHSFVTLTGQSTVPGYGYVGWVRAEEPTGNHFTDPEIIVGYSNRRHTSYLGAAQFQVDPIPAGATITNATLQFCGGRWIYDEDNYQWNVTLLNSSMDANWVNHAYGDIAGAEVDLVMTPVLDDVDLIEGEWNHFYFQQSEYPLLRQHFDNSRISFGINGPTSDSFFATGLIFAWISGNEGGAGFVSPFSPRLTVTYSMTGDTVGPVIMKVSESWVNGAGDPRLKIGASASDLGFGDSNITNVEYYTGPDPGLGEGVALHPVDGAFDFIQEDCYIIIDVAIWTPGMYTFNLRARDQAGNWGPSYPHDVYVIPPLPASNVDARLEGAALENVNVTWTLSPDDGQGDDDITHYSIYYGTAYDKTAESYDYLGSSPAGTSYYVHSLSGNGDPDSYYYAVVANETFGNAKKASNQAGKFARTL
ncbi:MAG: M28 family peptidase, partial [Thermoplasmata archaeon]|nr:M28 family peptidase [Thermoplasmata archaeon]